MSVCHDQQQGRVLRKKPDIAVLAAKADKGDLTSFEALIEVLLPSFYKVAWSILKNDHDAADAVQETVIACWQHLGQLRDSNKVKSWALKILANKSRKMLHSRKTVAFDENAREQCMQDDYGLIEWKQLVGNLDEKYRLVFVLFYEQGLTTKEIASIAGITQSAVTTRLARARQQLRDDYTGSKRS